VADEEPVIRTGRRNFLDLLSRAFLALWGLGFAGVIYAFLRPRHRELLMEETFRAGTLSGLPVGQATIVQHVTGPVMIVRVTEREVASFSALCTHLRCVLQYGADSRTITCPCHGGAFDLHGNVLFGPPPKPLPTYAVEIRNDQIYVRMS
jgi:cytochrome b6-f complex iron-sulfur subunit